MKESAEHFEGLIKNWFAGKVTSTEVIIETKDQLKIQHFIDEGYQFDYAYSLAVDAYDKKYQNLVNTFLTEETVVCLTVDGVLRNLRMLRDGYIDKNQFLEWSSWSNIGCENSTIEIENICIEYLCTIFILKNEFLLESKQSINSLLEIVAASNSTSYEKFVFYIYLLIDSERKSIYYFFKDYLDSKKTNYDLNAYLVKKFNHSFPRFKYDLDRFPYKKEIENFRKENACVEKVISILEFRNA